MRHLIATTERPANGAGDSQTPGAVRGRAPGRVPSRREFAFAGIVGESRAVRSTIDYVRRLSQDEQATLHLVGAAGTGKGLFARAAHYAGPNAHLPFLVLDCKSTPDAMLETELFGYEAGAFEGAGHRKNGLLELAGAGTVYIEDITKLPQRLQPKLLRALSDRRVRRVGGREEYEIACTVITSSGRPLEELVAEGVFRDDLFNRLNATRISLPSLRDRGEDVMQLAEHFLAEIVREQGLLPIQLAQDAIHTLMAYAWPGNVRELKAVIERAAELCTGTHLHAEHLSIQRREACPMLAQTHAFEISVPGDGRSLKDIEAEAIRNTLEVTDGNQAAAARILEISPPTLARKIREYGLRDERVVAPAGTVGS